MRVLPVFIVNVKGLFDFEFFPSTFAAFEVHEPAGAVRKGVDYRKLFRAEAVVQSRLQQIGKVGSKGR